MQAAVDVLRDYGSAVVTGASSGIGKSFIATLAEANPEVRICNLSRAIPEQSGVRSFTCDFALPEARRAVFPKVAAWAASEAGPGRLLLINNSGFGCYGAFPEPKVRDHVEMIEVNIAAVVELTGTLLPELRRRGGAIVNVASTSAFQPTPWLQTYAATKAFLVSWSVALARELRGSGVHVLALCPGPTRTDFGRRAGFAGHVVSDRLSQDPAEVVETAFRALRRRRVVAVSGAANRVGATLARMLPIGLSAALADRVVGRYRSRGSV